MQPGAQLAAVVALLEDEETSLEGAPNVLPADRRLSRYLRGRRYIGAKDKAAIAGLYYFILRHHGALAWWAQHWGLSDTPRLRVALGAMWAWRWSFPTLQRAWRGARYGPEPLQQSECAALTAQAIGSWRHAGMPGHAYYSVPPAVYAQLQEAYGSETAPLLEAMLQEAPVDIRLNPLKARRSELEEALGAAGLVTAPTPVGAYGLRLQARAALSGLPAFKQGWFEVQDAASQYVAERVGARAHERVVDFCAGAGGKTLALAALMGNQGRLLALDCSEARLARLRTRAARAGVDTIVTRAVRPEGDPWLKRQRGRADRVLVDAPCSGSGTWRRHPDLKWRAEGSQLDELSALQGRLLSRAAALVRPGGRLVYATCSLLPAENEAVVERFLATHPVWQTGQALEMQQFLPHRDGTDGFFVAVLQASG